MIAVTLVEDNAALREELAFQLTALGHEVSALADGSQLDLHLARHRCDVLLLDIGLPGEDGLTIAARLRGRQDLGIVMLTARGMLDDRVEGLEVGADAYLVKPVNLRELVAVIGSVARRLRGDPVEAAPEAGGWRLLARSRTLHSPHGQAVTLTHMESVLMSLIANAAPEPASRDVLITSLGGNPLSFDERRIEVCLSRLRRKLHDAGCSEFPLRAARGVGYAFTDQIRVEKA